MWWMENSSLLSDYSDALSEYKFSGPVFKISLCHDNNHSNDRFYLKLMSNSVIIILKN